MSQAADMAEAIRRAFGDQAPIFLDGVRIPPPDRRPGAGVINELSIDSETEAFLNANVTGEESHLFHCNIWKNRAEKSLEARQYDDARSGYLKAIAALLGKNFKVPLPAEEGGVVSAAYSKLTAWERIDLMACCNGVARCMKELKDTEGVRYRSQCRFI